MGNDIPCNDNERISYQGGKLLTNVNVIPVFLGSKWLTETSHFGLPFKIAEFLRWFVKSPVIDMLQQDYSVPRQTIGYGTTDTPRFIATGLPAKLKDSDLQQIVNGWIEDSQRPVLPNDLFVIYVEGGVNVANDDGWVACNGLPGMCAYHLETINFSHNFSYAVIPFYSYADCAYCFSRLQLDYTFDVMTAFTCHEVCEAITDPHPLTDPAWFCDSNEIGDICETPPQAAVRLNGYALEKIYSRRQDLCALGPLPYVKFNHRINTRPALATNDELIFLAWATDSDHRIQISASNNPPFTESRHPDFLEPTSLNETCIEGPAISMGPGNKLWLAWTGTDSQQHLNVMAFDDLTTFKGTKHVFAHDTSSHGPAMAYAFNRLHIAYAASDNSREFYIISSADGIHWDRRVHLLDTTDAQPTLTAIDDKLYLLWRGTDSNTILNIMESTDGVSFHNKIMIGSSDYAPVLVRTDEGFVFVWRPRYGYARGILKAVSLSGASGFSSVSDSDLQTVDYKTSTGLAMIRYKSHAYIAFGSYDTSQLLSFAQVPVL